MAHKKITQAVILSAGLGTRLRPITNTVPKVMVPITNGKPLLAHTIEWMRDQGFDDFLINLHYFPDQITGYFGNGKKLGVRIRYSDETAELLETAGAIKKMEPLLADEFVLFYGDHLQFFDFSKLANVHRQKNAFATLALKTSDLPENGDMARIDPKTGRILDWYPRPHEHRSFEQGLYLNAGISILPKAICGMIPPGVSMKLDKEIVPRLVRERTDVFGYVTDDEILDIGTPEKYEYAKQKYRERMMGDE